MKNKRMFPFPALVLALFVLGSVQGVKCEDHAFNPLNASFEELMFHATRYGSTPEKRERKQAAREEMNARGTNSLAYLIHHTYISNMWFAVFAQDMVNRMEPELSAPVLLSALKEDREAVRRYAIYFLGYHETPEYAELIFPYMEDEDSARVTMRTLGKWRYKPAISNIVGYLTHEDERKRLQAVNALHDIADPVAVRPLIDALSDPVFTVRRAASRALTAMRIEGESALIAALPMSVGGAQRELIRTLGEMEAFSSIEALLPLLQDSDPYVRGEAILALRRIDPARCEEWFSVLNLDSEHPFVQSMAVIPGE